MPDQRRPGRVGTVAIGAALAFLLVAGWAAIAPAGVSAAGPGPQHAAEAPLLVPGDQGPQEPTTQGPDTGLILAIGAGVAVAGALLGGAFLMLRRRGRLEVEAPPGPAEGGDWWTCRECGRNNMVGSPRCYACGAWQR